MPLDAIKKRWDRSKWFCSGNVSRHERYMPQPKLPSTFVLYIFSYIICLYNPKKSNNGKDASMQEISIMWLMVFMWNSRVEIPWVSYISSFKRCIWIENDPVHQASPVNLLSGLGHPQLSRHFCCTSSPASLAEAYLIVPGLPKSAVPRRTLLVGCRVCCWRFSIFLDHLKYRIFLFFNLIKVEWLVITSVGGLIRLKTSCEGLFSLRTAISWSVLHELSL